ncbi:hypothetical protein BGX31_009987 [Mortierella sp. GBA43]|nr:hypothetical protein BGX31_009987 [Mortierella sp. GBA43]
MRKIKYPHAKYAEQERLKSILVQCRGLVHLNMNSIDENLFQVLRNNRETMVSFNFYSTSKDQYMMHLFWDVLSGATDSNSMANLRHLTLTGIKINSDRCHPGLHLAFVKLCQRLESLECIRCRTRDWNELRSPRKDDDEVAKTLRLPWTIRELKLVEVVTYVSFHKNLLKRCTSLERLTCTCQYYQLLDPVFLQFLVKSSLKYVEVGGLILPDEALAKLVENLPSTMTTLCFNPQDPKVTMGPRFVAALAAISFPLSIRSLRPRPLKLSSTLIQQLLSTCANIVHLDDSLFVNAVDLLSAPWVMSRLVKLRLTIKDVANVRTAPGAIHTNSGNSRHDGLDGIVYQQLSKLVSLEDLSLAEGWNSDSSSLDKGPWIEFSLRHGMGKLETLERLRRLDISRLQGLRMGADEGRWIRGHWPALEQLVVRSLHNHRPTHDYLMNYLHENLPRLTITED